MEGEIAAVQNVGFSYPGRQVISNVSLTIRRRTISVLMGPSGCGKSTLLRIIAGLLSPSHGSVTWVSDSFDDTQRLRIMFQDFDAFPWLNVWANVKYGSGTPPHPTDTKVVELLQMTGLYEHQKLFPNELSGGLRKRLALARSLVRRPRVLLLDEPFSSLDVGTKTKMYDLLLKLVDETECGVLMVSHDPHEAAIVADEVHIASHGPMSIRNTFSNGTQKPRRSESGDYASMVARLLAILEHQ